MTPYARPEAIYGCMDRLVARWRSMNTYTDGALTKWFKARYDYLDEEFRLAINASDNIIGKDYHYKFYRFRDFDRYRHSKIATSK